MCLSVFLSDFIAEILSVNELRTVPVKGNPAKVIDVEIVCGKERGKLASWNTIAEFFERFLMGKQVCTNKIKEIYIRI